MRPLARWVKSAGTYKRNHGLEYLCELFPRPRTKDDVIRYLLPQDIVLQLEQLNIPMVHVVPLHVFRQHQRTMGLGQLVSAYLWSGFKSPLFVLLSKRLESSLGLGALGSRRQELLLQARFAEDPPPAAGSFVDARPHLVDRVGFGVVYPAADEATPGFCMDVVAGKGPFPASARPLKS